MPKEFKTVVSSTSAIAFSAEKWSRHEYEPPPDDHPVYQLIGQVTAEWSRLEHALDRIIWSLAGTLSPEGACITSQVLGATARYKIILTLINLLKERKPNFGKYAEEIENLMRHSYDPQERRNRIVHDAWYIDSEKNAPGQFRSWPHKNPEFGIRAVDLSDIEKTIADAKSLAESAEALFKEINAQT